MTLIAWSLNYWRGCYHEIKFIMPIQQLLLLMYEAEPKDDWWLHEKQWQCMKWNKVGV